MGIVNKIQNEWIDNRQFKMMYNCKSVNNAFDTDDMIVHKVAKLKLG